MSHALLRHVHMSCALASFTLFVLRGVWRFGGSPLAQARWTRVVPHVIDTVLLATALGLAWDFAPYPALHGFLAAKVGGVVLYILLGMTAFSWGRTQRQRLAAWFAAQAVFFYIVAVALTKSPSLTLAG